MLLGVEVKSEQMSCESFAEDACHFIRLNATSSSWLGFNTKAASAIKKRQMVENMQTFSQNGSM